VVKRQLAPNDYEIMDGKGRKSQIVNVQRLKSYHQEYKDEVQEIPSKRVTFNPMVEATLGEDNEGEVIPLRQGEDPVPEEEISLEGTCLEGNGALQEKILPSGMRLRNRRRGKVVVKGNSTAL
jgi:hypothetical protein